MMKYRIKRIFLTFVFTLLTALLLAGSATVNAEASSWRPSEARSIYEGSAGVDAAEEEEEKESSIGKLVAPFFTSLGDGINALFRGFGLSLDSIIFGRVHGAAKRTGDVALFTYDTAYKNLYGLVSMAVYAIFSGYTYILLLVVVSYSLGMMAWRQSTLDKQAFEDCFGKVILIAVFLRLFPKIVDLMCLFRDNVLAMVIDGETTLYANVASALGGSSSLNVQSLLSSGSSASLLNIFRDQADTGVINSIMYLAVVFVTLAFALEYILVALSISLLVAFSPFIVVLHMGAKEELIKWAKNILGLLFTPVIDLTVLFVPLMIGAYKDAVIGGSSISTAVIQLIACISVIPARKYLLEHMGFGSAISSGVGVLKSVAGGVGVLLGRGLVSKFGVSSQNGSRSHTGGTGKNDISEAGDESGVLEDRVQTLENVSGDFEERARDKVRSIGDPTVQVKELSPEEKQGGVQMRANKRLENIQAARSDVVKRKVEKEDEISQTRETIDQLKFNRGQFEQMRASTSDPNDRKQLDDRINGLNQQISDLEGDPAIGKDGKMQRLTSDYQKLSETDNDLLSIQEQMEKVNKSYSTDKVTSALDDYANTENFESAEYKNISMERRAELMRAREMQRPDMSAAQSAVMNVGKTIGKGALYTAAGAATLMTPGGPAVGVGLAYGGVQIAGEVGDWAYDHGSKIVDIAKDYKDYHDYKSQMRAHPQEYEQFVRTNLDAVVDNVSQNKYGKNLSQEECVKFAVNDYSNRMIRDAAALSGDTRYQTDSDFVENVRKGIENQKCYESIEKKIRSIS